MIEMTKIVGWTTALVIVILLVIAGSAIAYILGQRAKYFVIERGEKACNHRIITAYEVFHAVLLAIFAVLMWGAFGNLIANFMVDDGYKDPTEIANTAIFLSLAISYLITVLLPRSFFAKGNAERYRIKKKRGVEPIVVEEKDIRKGFLFRVGHEDIVYYNSNLRQKISNRAS